MSGELRISCEMVASQQQLGMEGEDIAGIHCQAMPSEDAEDLACATVNCRVCESVITL
jgi:hypothetical protein